MLIQPSRKENVQFLFRRRLLNIFKPAAQKPEPNGIALLRRKSRVGLVVHDSRHHMAWLISVIVVRSRHDCSLLVHTVSRCSALCCDDIFKKMKPHIFAFENFRAFPAQDSGLEFFSHNVIPTFHNQWSVCLIIQVIGPMQKLGWIFHHQMNFCW